jgi:hypothetical protein
VLRTYSHVRIYLEDLPWTLGQKGRGRRQRTIATGGDSKDGSTVMSVPKSVNGLLHRMDRKEEGKTGRRRAKVVVRDQVS